MKTMIPFTPQTVRDDQGSVIATVRRGLCDGHPYVALTRHDDLITVDVTDAAQLIRAIAAAAGLKVMV